MNEKEDNELIKNQQIAMNIAGEYDLNIYPCNDGFYIIESWEDLDKLVAVFNSVPVGYIDYGRVDKDRVLDDSKEFYDIDSILGWDKWGFSDEYSTCGNCGNSIRTSPDSWSWKADYWINDFEIICGDCIRDDSGLMEDYIGYLVNNPKRANTLLRDSDMENHGFKKCHCGDSECSFETGWHQGQDDDPEKILKDALEKKPDYEFVFDITGVGQFDVNYTLWSREKKKESEDEEG